jgi:primosomal protein N' (replication factor Y)
MYILQVAPLTSGIPFEELSYFSKEELHPGDLVAITIRKRVSRAVVISSSPAKEEKQSLRHASFSIKKINRVIKREYISPSLWKGFAQASSYQLLSLGKSIYDVIPEKVFSYDISFVSPPDARGFENLLLQQPYNDRVTRYKSTIREMFAKKQSLVMFFPTISDIEHMQSLLAFGIEDYVVPFHSGLSDKQSTAALSAIKNEKHPILILSTPSLVPWTRSDLGLVILEREHSQYYFTHGETGYDMRTILVEMAKETKLPLIRGSHMLSLEAHLLHKKHDAHEVMPLHSRNDAPLDVVAMHDENQSASPYLSRKTLTLLHEIKKRKRGHYFLYSHRKGMYPTTVCGDCGTVFACQNCNRPYVLHKIGGVRTYVCHGCEHIVSVTEETALSCKYCGGWRMHTLGIATTGVEEELSLLGVPLFVIDSERTNTKAKAKKVYKEWKQSAFGVLIGTEMAHNLLDECDGATILSLDSLFALPEYRTDEKIITLVTELAEKIKQTQDHDGRLILQTRLKKMPVIKHLQSSSYVTVYHDMLRDREEALLPPYYTVIKASFDNLSDEMRNKMEQALEPYTLEWFEAGRGITLLFIHIKEATWSNDAELREKVKYVLQDGRPQVNPLHFFIQ